VPTKRTPQVRLRPTGLDSAARIAARLLLGEDRHHANDENVARRDRGMPLRQTRAVPTTCRRFGNRRTFRQHDFRTGGSTRRSAPAGTFAMEDHRVGLAPERGT